MASGRPSTTPPPASHPQPRGAEIFTSFLRLGCTAFGGPVAHLGYFHSEFITRRRWLDEAAYAELVALCQFLPGPASSKVGFLLGVLRGGGLWGGLLAWLAFTLPSALLMLAFAVFATSLHGAGAQGAVHGLKIVAVAVVAHAVWGMAQRLTPDLKRRALALVCAGVALSVGGTSGQLGGILLGAVAGGWLCRRLPTSPEGAAMPVPIRKTHGAIALLLFAVLLVALPLLGSAAAPLNAFYRAGALVFGGGHVLLPLLEAETVRTGWVSADAFLAGYGVAQALPGPLFTFAAYLGALPFGLWGGVAALIAVFLPGCLLAYGTLPFWARLRERPAMRAIVAGANAAVVGILAAALITPVSTSAIHTPWDLLGAGAGLLLLMSGRLPVWAIVALLTSLYSLSALC